MAYDGDVLQIKTLTAIDAFAGHAAIKIDEMVNAYLSNYPADLVQSIQMNVTEVTDTSGDYPVASTRYTATIVLRS